MSLIEGSFERSGHSWRIVVDVLIRPPDEPTRWEQARAVVDTGANRTALTGKLATALNLPPRGKRVVTGAHGQNMHNLYDFELGFVIGASPAAQFVFSEGLIQGMDWGGHAEFDVLLGMDVISQCDLSARRDHSFAITI